VEETGAARHGTAVRGLTGCAHQICVACEAKWESGTDRLRPLVWLVAKLDLARGKALARLASGSSLLSIVVGVKLFLFSSRSSGGQSDPIR
jgi:hypothetical protein